MHKTKFIQFCGRFDCFKICEYFQIEINPNSSRSEYEYIMCEHEHTHMQCMYVKRDRAPNSISRELFLV